MKCPNCGSDEVREIRRPYRYTESGLDSVFLKGVPYLHCSNCRDEVVQVPSPQLLHEMIAENVAVVPRRLEAKEIRFLRTQLGWSQQMLADRLGVDRVTVCRWESERENQRPEPHTDFAIRFVWIHSRLAEVGKRQDGRTSRKRIETLTAFHDALANVLGRLGLQEQKTPRRIVVDVPKMRLVGGTTKK